MDIQALPRTAVERWIRVMRLPIDATMALIDREGTKAPAVRLSVDRVDNAARRLAGRVLHDERLQRDAEERGVAIEERVRALRLRSEAGVRRQRADTDFQEDVDEAIEQRTVAEHRAEQQRQKIAEEQRGETERIAAATRKRKAANNETAERTEARIRAQAEKTRLAQLEREAEVLDARDESLTVESEAQRLERQASEVKAERKSN